METYQIPTTIEVVKFRGCETARLQFILRRDGLKAAVQFAEQNMRAYRRAYLKGFGRIPRKLPPTFVGYIDSYLSFKYFYFTNKGLIENDRALQ